MEIMVAGFQHKGMVAGFQHKQAENNEYWVCYKFSTVNTFIILCFSSLVGDAKLTKKSLQLTYM